MTQREKLTLKKRKYLEEHYTLSRKLSRERFMPRKQYTAGRRRLLVLETTIDNLNLELEMAL